MLQHDEPMAVRCTCGKAAVSGNRVSRLTQRVVKYSTYSSHKTKGPLSWGPCEDSSGPEGLGCLVGLHAILQHLQRGPHQLRAC